MKSPTILRILTILVSVVLFFTGIYFYERFFEWTLPNVDGLRFQQTTLGGNFKDMLAFSFSFAFIPISAFLTWKFAPIIGTKGKLVNVLILLGSVLLGALLRKKWLSVQSDIYLKEIREGFGDKFNYLTPIENFNVTNYMLLGLVIGTAISYFALRQNTAKKELLN